MPHGKLNPEARRGAGQPAAICHAKEPQPASNLQAHSLAEPSGTVAGPQKALLARQSGPMCPQIELANY